MKCYKCNSEISNNANFCNICGSPVFNTQTEKQTSFSKNTKYTSKRVIISVVSIIVVSLLILTILLTRYVPNSDTKAVIEGINAIGTVEISDENNINELIIMYNGLSNKEKKHVKNYDKLQKAVEELNSIKEYENMISTPPYSVAIELANVIKGNLNNPDSFNLYDVRCYKGTYGLSYKYDFYYDYSGENRMGGTTRKQIVIEYANNNVSVYDDRNLYAYIFELFEKGDNKKIEFLDADIIKSNL